MHDLRTLERINSGELEVSRSADFSPAPRAREVEDVNPRKAENPVALEYYVICNDCKRAISREYAVFMVNELDQDYDHYICVACVKVKR